jgi:hypothetical protein
MNHTLAHHIYAGADMFLMPSMFEPCGLSQMISMRYGTLPVVRETGGLRDTVLSYNGFTGSGNGFTFLNYNAHDMLHVIERAVGYYRDHPDVWRGLMARAMAGNTAGISPPTITGPLRGAFKAGSQGEGCERAEKPAEAPAEAPVPAEAPAKPARKHAPKRPPPRKARPRRNRRQARAKARGRHSPFRGWCKSRRRYACRRRDLHRPSTKCPLCFNRSRRRARRNGIAHQCAHWCAIRTSDRTGAARGREAQRDDRGIRKRAARIRCGGCRGPVGGVTAP